MNKSYCIKKMNENNIWIFATDISRIHDYINDLEFELKQNDIVGDILFDLLLSNGLSNSFFCAYFDGDKFNISSFKNIKEIDFETLCFINKYHSNNLELIDKSALTKTQKFLFRKNFK